MPLRALLADVDPAWYARGDGQAFDPQLVALARTSALGQRLLVRTLPATLTTTLLAPRPGAGVHVAMATRWSRERLAALGKQALGLFRQVADRDAGHARAPVWRPRWPSERS